MARQIKTKPSLPAGAKHTSKSPAKTTKSGSPESSKKSKGSPTKSPPAAAKQTHVTPTVYKDKATTGQQKKPPASQEDLDAMSVEDDSQQKKPPASTQDEEDPSKEDESSQSSFLASDEDEDASQASLPISRKSATSVKAQLGQTQLIEQLRNDLPNIKWEIEKEQCKNFFHFRDVLDGFFRSTDGWTRLRFVTDATGKRYNIFTDFINVDEAIMRQANHSRINECATVAT